MERIMEFQSIDESEDEDDEDDDDALGVWVCRRSRITHVIA
jgi:hypothetical protein